MFKSLYIVTLIIVDPYDHSPKTISTTLFEDREMALDEYRLLSNKYDMTEKYSDGMATFRSVGKLESDWKIFDAAVELVKLW